MGLGLIITGIVLTCILLITTKGFKISEMRWTEYLTIGFIGVLIVIGVTNLNDGNKKNNYSKYSDTLDLTEDTPSYTTTVKTSTNAKQVIKELYYSLRTEFEKQKNSYNYYEWHMFSNRWNKDRDNKASELDNSELYIKSAMGSLFSLWQEYDNIILNRNYDLTSININVENIEYAIK